MTHGMPQDDRAVGVLVGGRALEVAGPAAELVALLAEHPPSARTLRLLLAVAAAEDRLARIGHGSLTVDLAPREMRLHLREVGHRLEVVP